MRRAGEKKGVETDGHEERLVHVRARACVCVCKRQKQLNLKVRE
jgi:hypothetical protein